MCKMGGRRRSSITRELLRASLELLQLISQTSTTKKCKVNYSHQIHSLNTSTKLSSCVTERNGKGKSKIKKKMRDHEISSSKSNEDM